MKKLRCASFFAGVGGIDIGFEGYGIHKSDCFEVIYANEFDPYPVKTYELNNNLKVDCRDIREVVKDIDKIPDFEPRITYKQAYLLHLDKLVYI